MVFDFFKNLGRSRIQGVKAAAKGKMYGAQAKAKGKAASKFNKAVDGAAKGAKDKATGKGKKKGDKDQDAKGGKVKGVFGGKKAGGGGPPQAEQYNDEPAGEFGDKTQIFSVVEDERPKECVGWVVCLNGAQKGQDFRLTPGRNVVGTAADVDIVLTDQYMSSRHAVIRYEEGVFMLVDLDSTNGSCVNDQRSAKEELIDNDRLRFGRTELKFKSLY